MLTMHRSKQGINKKEKPKNKISRNSIISNAGFGELAAVDSIY